MDDVFDEDEDRMAAARRRRDAIDEVDEEIREEARPEVIEQRRREAAARERWRSLPPVRLRPGVGLGRLTDDEAAYMDRNGY